jgi:hypothetical protein
MTAQVTERFVARSKVQATVRAEIRKGRPVKLSEKTRAEWMAGERHEKNTLGLIDTFNEMIEAGASPQFAMLRVIGLVLEVMHHDLDHLDEKIIKPIEERAKEFRFLGQWQEGKTYKSGNFVSMGGQVYHANADTDSRPGTDGTWTLAVRSGRDGRDGKDAGPPEPPGQRMVRTRR